MFPCQTVTGLESEHGHIFIARVFGHVSQGIEFVLIDETDRGFRELIEWAL